MAEEWEDLIKKAQYKNLKNYSAEELHKKFPDKSISFFNTSKKIAEITPYERDQAVKNKNTLENPPDKKIIRHRGLVISPEVAILEFLDNIFDNYHKNTENDIIDHILEIELIFYSTEDDRCLIVKENSGGIRNEDLRPLLIMGTSSTEGEKKVGTWGEALLNSIRSLGTSAEIYSKHPNGKPIKILIPEEFFQPGSEWRIEYYIYDSFADLKNIDRGISLLKIHGISSKYSTNEKSNFDELLNLIEDTYWMKVSEIRKVGLDVKLSIDYYSSEILKAKFADLDFESLYSHHPFSVPLFLRDYKIPVILEDGTKGEVNVDAYCGLNPSIKKIEPYYRYRGVWMWGNDRLFALDLNDINVGFGLSETNIPTIKNRYFAGMLAIFLFFKSKNPKFNQFIPWRIPTKNGYNPENTIKSEIIKLIKTLVERFIDPIKNLKGPIFQFKVFSQTFINLEEQEKLSLISDAIFSEKEEELDDDELKIEFSSFINLTVDDLIPLERYDFSEIQELSQQNSVYKKSIKDFDRALKKGSESMGFFPVFMDVLHKSKFLPIFEEDGDFEEVNESIYEYEKKFSEEEEFDILIDESKELDKINEARSSINNGFKRIIPKSETIQNRQVNSVEIVKKSSEIVIPLKKAKVPSKAESQKLTKKITAKKLENSRVHSKDIIKQVKEKEPLVKVSFSIEKLIISKLRKKYGIDSKKRPGTVVKVALKSWIKDQEDRIE